MPLLQAPTPPLTNSFPRAPCRGCRALAQPPARPAASSSSGATCTGASSRAARPSSSDTAGASWSWSRCRWWSNQVDAPPPHPPRPPAPRAAPRVCAWCRVASVTCGRVRQVVCLRFCWWVEVCVSGRLGFVAPRGLPHRARPLCWVPPSSCTAEEAACTAEPIKPLTNIFLDPVVLWALLWHGTGHAALTGQGRAHAEAVEKRAPAAQPSARCVGAAACASPPRGWFNQGASCEPPNWRANAGLTGDARGQAAAGARPTALAPEGFTVGHLGPQACTSAVPTPWEGASPITLPCLCGVSFGMVHRHGAGTHTHTHTHKCEPLQGLHSCGKRPVQCTKEGLIAVRTLSYLVHHSRVVCAGCHRTAFWARLQHLRQRAHCVCVTFALDFVVQT